MAGAGPTLSSSIRASMKQVVDTSFMLWRESACFYDSCSSKQKLTIPQIVGTIWDACSALKKTSATNITAIQRAMIQVAASMKDVLREMRELRPCSSNSMDNSLDASSVQPDDQSDEGDDSSFGNLVDGLSPEEMKNAELAARAVSELLLVIKELVLRITRLPKQGHESDTRDEIKSLEMLLKLCQNIVVEVDELGACLYPPQETSSIIAAHEKITGMVEEMEVESDAIKGSTSAFHQACQASKIALVKSKLQVSMLSVDALQLSAELVQQMQNLSVAK
ncbi:hypothetical protein AKJ16_DCAP01581 [Drosera capensis]